MTTIDQTHQAATRPAADARPAVPRRATIYPYLAAVWSLLYAGLAFGWAADLPGWPALPFDRSADTPLPGSFVPPAVLAAVALLGAGLAVALANRWGSGRTRTALAGSAWALSGGLLLGFTTAKVLALVGYAPIFLIGAPFDYPPVSYADQFTWPVVHELISMLGGALWALSAMWYDRVTMRRSAPDLVRDGRVTGVDRAAVAIAVAVPVWYAATRYAWLLGIPFGISEEFLRAGQEIGLWVAGAGLATFGMVGAVLTLGLVQRWGEVFPRWMPVVRGRPVPRALATVPAGAASVLLITGGFSLWWDLLLHPELPDNASIGAVAPGMGFLLWGVALAVATHGYRRRRLARAAQPGTSS